MASSSRSTSWTVMALDWARSSFSFSLSHTIRFSVSDVYSCQSFNDSSSCCWLLVTRFVIITHRLDTLSSSMAAWLLRLPVHSSMIRWPVEQRALYPCLWVLISFWHIWKNRNVHGLLQSTACFITSFPRNKSKTFTLQFKPVLRWNMVLKLDFNIVPTVERQ